MVGHTGQGFLDFLNRLPARVLVVDNESLVVHANTLNLESLGKQLSDVRGKLGGEVFECEYSYLPGGCGQTEHCHQCVIRQTVMGTMADGVAKTGVMVKLCQRQPDQSIIWLNITFSTEKAGSVVLLRIDDIRSKET